LLSLLLLAGPASAASLTWDGSSSGNWGTAANWTGNAVPAGTTASPDLLTFPTAGANKTMSNNLTAGLSFNRLSFTDGYTVSGSGLTLRFHSTAGNPRVEYTAASGEATVNVPLTLVNPATFVAAAGGRLNLGASSDPVLGANTLTLTANSNGRIEMDGSTSGTGSVTMNGAGLVVLDASQNSIGTYSLTSGSCTLLTSTIAGPITTSAGTQLSSVNANASSNVTIAGNLDVSLSFDIAGNLSFTGSGADDDLSMGISGTLPGSTYDQIDVDGSLTTGAHRLQLSAAGGYPLGTEFTLIRKNSFGPMTSTTKFLNSAGSPLNDGTQNNYGTLRLQFSYAGGDGNDFTATIVPPVSTGTTREWDGGTDADNKLRTANNWASDALPAAGDRLQFAGLAVEKTILNNGGGSYSGLYFGSSGYSLQDDPDTTSTGKLIALGTQGLVADHGAGSNAIAVPLEVTTAQSWSVNAAGSLTVAEAATVSLTGSTLTLNPTSTGTLTVNAPVSGSGNVNKDGSGLAVIGGAAANTFTGTTAVSRGELRLSKSGSATALTGSVSVGGGANAAILSTTAAENIADSAVLTLNNNGTLQLGATETLAGLVINGGALNNGANVLALAGNLTANENLALSSPLQFNGAGREITVASGKALTFSGALSISPGVLGVTHFKKGPGTLIFSGTVPAVALSADAGVLQIDTTDAVNRPLVSLNGGTVQGNGRSRQVTSAAGGGTFSPGLGTGSSIWRNTGLAFNAATTVVLDLNGTTAGTQFDQLTVLESGTVSPGNAALQIRDTQVYPLGTSFRIIDNDGTDAVTGTFAGLPAGASIGGTFNRYTITYAGGTGNDVVLTVAAVDSGVTRTWTGGGGADRQWSNASNWGGAVPQPGDTLVFPLTAMTSGSGPINNLTTGLIFNRIRFTGSVNNTGNYSISGNPLGLVAGVENVAEETANPFSRDISIGIAITTQPGAVISNNPASNPRTLVFTQPVTTTGGSLRFAGRGAATPQGSIRFSGTAATLSGPARLYVESNASVSLNGFSTSTWSGGTEIIHGSLSSIPHERLAEGFVLTAGANPVSAGILAGTVSSGTAITVPANGSLAGGPLLCASLNVVGTATLGGGATVTGTVDVTGTLATAGATLSAATLNVSPGATVSGGSLDVTTLNNTNATLNFTGSAAIGSGVVVDGSDVFTCAALTTTDFLRDGGTFTATDMTLSGGFSLISVNQTIAGRLTFQPGAVRLLSVGSGAFFTAAALGGPIGTPVSIQKIAGGFVHITDSLSNIGGLTITDGYFLSDAPDGDSGVQIVSVEGGTLGGSGVFSDVVVATTTPARVSPGASPGILTADSLLTSGGGNIAGLTMEISGPSVPGTFYDQIRVMGDVNFTGSSQMQFDLSITGGYQPLTGTVYTFVEKVSPGPIGGVLNSGDTILSEGQELEVDGITFRFSYLGGDGNDFTATVINSPAGAYRIWDGGGADANWTTAANWVDDTAPVPSESLRFPAGAAQTANNNNFPADTAIGEIKIESAYTLSGNRVRPAGGIKADIPAGLARITMRLFFDLESGLFPEIELAGAGALDVAGQIDLADGVILTLRRTDPGFLFGGQPLDVSSIRRTGFGSNEVRIEGGGRVRFLNGFRDYTGATLVRHGRLQLSGAASAIPGNLTIGGGAGDAKFENPGSAAGGISLTATLRLEPNGEHLFIGGGTHTDTIGSIDFAGGSATGGSLPVRNTWTTRAPFNYSSSGTRLFDTTAGLATKVIHIEAGATHTIPASSGIATTDGNPLHLRKEGGGELRIAGALTSATTQVAAGTLTVDSTGAILSAVTVAGGILAGTGSVNADLSGNASGGTVAPGLPTGANPFGILTIVGNGYLPAQQTTLSLQIGGTTPGTQHDQIRQTQFNFNSPPLDLNDSQLALTLANGFQPAPGQTFRIIDKQTPGAVVRNFAGKPEGHTFTAAGYEWTITYQGGDGNDVAVTALGGGLTSLQQWRQTHFGTTENAGEAADDFDFDHDGLTNLVEFGFGLDPKSPGSATLPRAVEEGGDSVLHFTPPPDAGGITYHGETSTALAPGSWTPVPNTGTAPAIRFVIPGTGPRAFFRIRITVP